MLSDRAYPLTARFDLAKAAGKLKLPSATGPLTTILTEDRLGLTLMLSAAWALQEITGKTPDIPEPKTRQGNWVIQKID